MPRPVRIVLSLLLLIALCVPGLAAAQPAAPGAQPRVVVLESFMLGT